MQIRKYSTLKLIYKGNVQKIKCVYSDKKYCNNIKVFYSEDIKDIEIVRFKDDTILVILNNNFESKTDRENLEVLLKYSILKELGIANLIIDIGLAQNYGFSKIINMIKNNILGEHLEERIDSLEKTLRDIKEAKTYNINNIINKVKYIEVGDLDYA